LLSSPCFPILYTKRGKEEEEEEGEFRRENVTNISREPFDNYNNGYFSGLQNRNS
jgi:hypothetical protein